MAEQFHSSPPTLSTALQRPLDERGAQGAESQHLKLDSCLPSHACIWAKTLSLRGLQNTHTSLCARTARYSAFPSTKTATNVDDQPENRRSIHEIWLNHG